MLCEIARFMDIDLAAGKTATCCVQKSDANVRFQADRTIRESVYERLLGVDLRRLIIGA